MTGTEFKTVIDFEHSLKVGDKVRVNWTNCGLYLTAKATVHKVNAKSVVLTLDEHVVPDHYGGWSAGQKIRVPRIEAIQLWSCNNCVQSL